MTNEELEGMKAIAEALGISMQDVPENTERRTKVLTLLEELSLLTAQITNNCPSDIISHTIGQTCAFIGYAVSTENTECATEILTILHNANKDLLTIYRRFEK